MIESQISLDEHVENKERKFGAAVTYYPVFVIDEMGRKVPALFTQSQIDIAVQRAMFNTEDIPVAKKSFFESLFGKIFG